MPKSNQKAAKNPRTYKIPWPQLQWTDPAVIRVTSAGGLVYARVLTDDDPDPLPSPPGNGWTLLEEDDDAG